LAFSMATPSPLLPRAAFPVSVVPMKTKTSVLTSSCAQRTIGEICAYSPGGITMRIKGTLGLWILSWAAVAALPGFLAGQGTKGSSTPEPSTQKKEEFKGEAGVSVHPYKMEKDGVYRITVRADGFAPQLRFGEQNSGAFPRLTGVYVLNPISTMVANPYAVSGTRQEAQLMFVAPATKSLPISVDYSAGSEIRPGSTYTLTIERANFKSHAGFQAPQLPLASHARKLEKGKAYSITVTGQGFAPQVQLLDGSRSLARSANGRWFGFGPDSEFISNLVVTPAVTKEYRILVSVGPTADKRQAPLQYTTHIVEVKKELDIEGKLTNQDPIYPARSSRHKVHTALLQEGKTYQIDMISRAVDAYLFVEDAAGQALTQDDESGGNHNARIIFRPRKSAAYRIIATTFDPASSVKSVGAYSLTVIENPHAQPGFAFGSARGDDLPDVDDQARQESPKSSAIGRLALALLAMGGGAETRTEQASDELYRRTAASTAMVLQNWRGANWRGFASGFVIDVKERLLITARHCVENVGGGLASTVEVVFPVTRDGEIVTEAAYYQRNRHKLAVRGRVLYDSVRRDLAIVQLDKLPPGIKALPLAPRNARPGQRVHVVGNSGDQMGAVLGYCHGYVRNVFYLDWMGARVITTQVPANPGDSGGPMVNDFGQIIGFISMGPPKTPGGEVQLLEIGICVSEIHEALAEMRSALAGRDQPPGAVTLQGEFKSGSHAVMMEMDNVYRITVKAEGFTPDVQVDGRIQNAVAIASRGSSHEIQFLFTPKQSKEQRVQVAPYPGMVLADGAHPYTLSIDRANFATETTIQEQPLRLNEHVKRFEAGKVYNVTVRAKNFEPDVQVADARKSIAVQFNGGVRSPARGFLESLGLADANFETTLRFVAGRSADYRILVAVSPYSRSGTAKLDYTVQVAEQHVDFSASDRLTADGPRYPQAGPYKIHTVKLQAGKNYQIDLLTTEFDSQVVLEDADGKLLLRGFDVEGSNARLFFRPAKTGTYRIVATSHDGNATGAYTVLVSESLTTVPGFPGSGKLPVKSFK
jgi:S1-C subfamily serine protease